MKYYLIDTSAFVFSIENMKSTQMDFFVEKAKGEAFLYMPQFCVTEVFNTYARKFYEENTIQADVYGKWRNAFISAIHNRRILYCYDLHRYHNLNAHKIYKLEHKGIPRSSEYDRLSGFDILIIAMGMELKKVHAPNDVFILTRDKRLKRISNAHRDFAKAIWFE